MTICILLLLTVLFLFGDGCRAERALAWVCGLPRTSLRHITEN